MKKIYNYIVIILIMTFVLAIPIYAENEVETETGWIEIKATVPDDFLKTIGVVLADDNNNVYSYRLFKDNNYITHEQLPVGNYYVMDALVEYDVKMDYPISFWPYELTVINTNLASLITIDVSNDSLFKKDEEIKEDVIVEEPIIEQPTSEPIKEKPIEEVPTLEEPITVEPSVEETKPESETKSKEPSILSSLIICLIIIIILFIIFKYIKYKQEN